MPALSKVQQTRVWLAVSLLCISAPANAEDAETETGLEATDYRDDARRLATEAAQRYQAGDYATALDLFTRSAKLYDAPTLRFWQARCLEGLGRLVDAERS